MPDSYSEQSKEANFQFFVQRYETLCAAFQNLLDEPMDEDTEEHLARLIIKENELYDLQYAFRLSLNDVRFDVFKERMRRLESEIIKKFDIWMLEQHPDKVLQSIESRVEKLGRALMVRITTAVIHDYEAVVEDLAAIHFYVVKIPELDAKRKEIGKKVSFFRDKIDEWYAHTENKNGENESALPEAPPSARVISETDLEAALRSLPYLRATDK